MTIKNIYRREDLGRYADYFMSFREQLTQDFLKFSPDYVNGSFKEGHAIPQAAPILNNVDDWLSTPIKYVFDDLNVSASPESAVHLKTAINLVKEFEEDCPIANYSVIKPNSCIFRHTGPENRSGEFVRVHIPLIVPQGDIFFEVGGEIVRWDDIFAFNNEIVHSAHNHTPFWRLVFLIDIRRNILGLPPGRPYDKVRDEDSYPPFHCINGPKSND
jgi:Aspartyl/Asparaginyl beta-hydroxylase